MSNDFSFLGAQFVFMMTGFTDIFKYGTLFMHLAMFRMFSATLKLKIKTMVIDLSRFTDKLDFPTFVQMVTIKYGFSRAPS